MVIARIVQAGKEYKTGDTLITALRPTDLELQAGELTLILGPSGSGKTTLLSLLGCIIYPSFGEVVIEGKRVSNYKEKSLAALRLEKIGFVFQNFNLIAPLNALENVMMPLRLQGMSERAAKTKALQALEKVGMGDRIGHLPKALSGGQQQRVAIARALVTNPAMLLCDEPTASLDIKSVSIVMKELKDLADQGKAVVAVTHDTRLIPYAGRIIYVSNGQVSDKPFETEELPN